MLHVCVVRAVQGAFIQRTNDERRTLLSLSRPQVYDVQSRRYDDNNDDG